VRWKALSTNTWVNTSFCEKPDEYPDGINTLEGMSLTKTDKFLKKFRDWVKSQPDIVAVALVGSHARDAATEASDVDLVIITHHPDNYLKDLNWIHAFGQAKRYQIENYGKLISVRVWYKEGPEVEYGITDETWAELPLDEGTREVIAGGMRVLFEKGNILSRHQSGHKSQ
jgi:predicted nucleotidyltransferase